MNIEKLSVMAAMIEEAEKWVDQYEQQLKKAKEELLKRQIELAEAMADAQCESFVSTSGLKVSVKNEFRVTLREDRGPGIAALEAGGWGGIVKNKVTVNLGRGDDIAPLKNHLLSLGLTPEIKPDVPWQTLTKLAKEIEEEGKEFPREHFNVLDRVVAKVKRA
jgi:hypothetical protein